MVLVAGLDRLEGTKVGPWLTDAEWQDHTVEFATAVRPVWRSNFRHPTVPMTA